MKAAVTDVSSERCSGSAEWRRTRKRETRRDRNPTNALPFTYLGGEVIEIEVSSRK